MEIKCTKCRYKFDVTAEDNQQEMIVVCPRCGATQTFSMPPAVPVSDEAMETIPVVPVVPVETVAAEESPMTSQGSIPEEHLKYIPHAEENTVVDIEQPNTVEPTAMPDEKQIEPSEEKADSPISQSPKRPNHQSPKQPKKKSSCGKMFALGCLIVAVLAVLTIAILAFIGKGFFNSISSNDDEQEQVDRSDRNITIQPENDTNTPNSQTTSTPDDQTNSTPNDQPAPVTDTGGEGNDNTDVQEPTKPTEEEKQKSEKDVATAGGSFNCRGTMNGKNIDLKLNITAGGFVTGKLIDNSSGTSLDITGDRYGDDYFLTASNSTDLINITLKKQGRTLKGTAKKELQSMPISVSY